MAVDRAARVIFHRATTTTALEGHSDPSQNPLRIHDYNDSPTQVEARRSRHRQWHTTATISYVNNTRKMRPIRAITFWKQKAFNSIFRAHKKLSLARVIWKVLLILEANYIPFTSMRAKQNVHSQIASATDLKNQILVAARTRNANNRLFRAAVSACLIENSAPKIALAICGMTFN